MNFEQILEQKMRSQDAQNAGFTTSDSTLNQPLDPAHMAFLMGHIPRKTQLAGHYHATKYKPTKTAQPKPAHTLNEAQTCAFVFILKLVPSLRAAFTAAELKTAFRQAALQVHPDCGGSAQEFVQLREHYQTLSRIFNK